MFTEEEKDFIKNLLDSLSIKPSSPDAEKVVEIIKSILGKLNIKETENALENNGS